MGWFLADFVYICRPSVKQKVIMWLLLTLSVGAFADTGVVRFRQFSTTEGLPNSMVHQVAQDEDGFIWIATYFGLYRYDGYELRPFKSDAENPTLLPSNNVVCIALGSRQDLWIGTHEGLARLHLKTGIIRKYPVAGVGKQRVNDICITRKGRMVAACIRGLVYYDEKQDTVLLMTSKRHRGDIPVNINIQAVCEDADGDLLVATWEKGLYRLESRTNRFLHYPSVNGIRQFLTVFTDSRGNVWAGSSGHGVLRLNFSPDKRQVTATPYVHSTAPFSIVSDYVYDICEDRESHTLWMGTRNGLSLMQGDRFLNYTGEATANVFPGHETGHVFQDRDGKMWISTKGAGILTATIRPRIFSNQFLTNRADGTDGAVSSIFVEGNGGTWTGMGYGVRYQSAATARPLLHSTTLLPDKRTYHISQSQQTSHVYIATHDAGLLECKDGAVLKQYTTGNSRFIPHDLVYMATEDVRGNLWVASYQGLGVRYADGKTVCWKQRPGSPSVLTGEIISVVEGSNGTLWIATPNNGIAHLSGNMRNPAQMRCDVYRMANGKCPINTVHSLKIDRRGRLWAGTEGCGLCLYDASTDCFRSVHQSYNLPGDMVNSIEEDKFGHLWVGTNQGLARLVFSGSGKSERVSARTFTTADGLPDNFFEQNAACRQGDRLYFGCGRGCVVVQANDSVPSDNHHLPAITQVLMNGRRENVAGMNEHIVIPPSVSDFTLCFSALCYTDQQHCSYAYRLEGYGQDWHYVTAANRSATYTNIPPGTYTFQLKATDEEGVWSDVKSVTVVVEPPLWRTWWAYLIYTAVALLVLCYMVRELRRRMMLRNKLRFKMNDGELQLVVDHQEVSGEKPQQRKQISFEVRDLNYTDADEDFLRRAIRCVNEHIGDADFDIPQFVREMGTSRTTLFKKLKGLTGLSATAFIRDIRLKTSCQFLDKNPKTRISDLAYQVGFTDPKYFSVCFKKEFGVSPSEYVEQQ